LKITKQEIVDAINIFIKEYGRYPSKKEFITRDDLPSQQTVLRYIGKQDQYTEHGILPVEKIKIINYCKLCNKEISKYNNFCNQSCAAIFNNTARIKHPKNIDCLVCNKKISNNNEKFCSLKCDATYKHKNVITNWLENNATIGPRPLKRYLINLYGHRCSNCENSTWNGQPIPIELEYKDGNSQNNRPENLCLLCPNCHAQTPTYKSKNKGSGRHYRRQRYKEGKSF
jgi:predicted nucleic acid-binding Zn ribbon protein